MNCDTSSILGSNPYSPKWQIVRGDTAKLRIEFYEKDGKTLKDISSWTFLSYAHNAKTDTDYQLTVNKYTGYVEIVADNSVTSTWGTGHSSIVAELSFDLQATISGEPWTPVLGTIVVLSDITGAL